MKLQANSPGAPPGASTGASDAPASEARRVPERLTRPSVPALDAILGQPFPVLDDGFVRLLDYMGDDAAVVQAARISYGAGTRRVHEDRGLIRYLMRHSHTTPFEMCEIKLHVRVPMDVWRQWIRHRTACLAEGTEIYFDLPGGIRRRGNQLYKLKIEEIWERFQPTCNKTRPDKQKEPYFRRDHIRAMRLRQVNEDTLEVQHTRIVDVYKNGKKSIFRMTLADGKQIECTCDHRFLFSDGWHTLADATGLHEQNGKAIWNPRDYYLYTNGFVMEAPVLYQNREWLNGRYNVRGQYAAQFSGVVVKTAWKKRPRVAWNKLTLAKLIRIEKCEFIGYKETYDIEVEGPYHNFVANGIVTHNSVNEYSTRYSIAIDAAQRTLPDEWRRQSTANRQGSSGSLPAALGERLSAAEQELQQRARAVYEARLAAGVAREQARKDLPLSTYTEAYWKIDLHNLLHFLHLRMDAHAQREIRAYAMILGEEIVAQWVPIVWEAFLDYRRHAVQLSRLEVEIVSALNSHDPERARHLAARHGLLNRRQDGSLVPQRERRELEAKLRVFGLTPPWESTVD